MYRHNHVIMFCETVGSLLEVAKKITPEDRAWLQMYSSEMSPPEMITALAEEFSIDDFRKAAEWMGDFFPSPFEKDTPQEKLLTFSQDARVEMLRQKIHAEANRRDTDYDAIVEAFKNIGLKTLEKAIKALENVPLNPESIGLDLPGSSSPENTRLHRALTALKHYLEAQEENHPNITNIQDQTQKFILGILNPLAIARFRNITDVFGSEPDVSCSENDATRIRICDHRKEIEDRYGVELDVFDQGTTIKCPEQCGFYALIAVNQARRFDPGRKIRPRFFALNNASRTKNHDRLEGAEASASDPLVYFRFDLGDGVEHSGTAYGYQTLTYLKPYLTTLWTIEGAEKGTQFRSLEFQQHITTEVAMTGGEFPACYKGKKLNIKTTIPSLDLAKNEFQYMGMDKYGNGITSGTANEVITNILGNDESPARIRVTILDRQKKLIKDMPPKEYTFARSLGLIRDGHEAAWESSTPTTENPKHGYLSVGRFMKEPGDINVDVVKMTPGCIIRIEKIDVK